MSYLDGPRINFSGMFQADVSTINNDLKNFDVAHFDPGHQALGPGGWNPEGTGSFRLVDCVVCGAAMQGKLLTSAADDPVIGMRLENAGQRVSGKLVDLDPQQQMVSEIWGMRLRLSDGGTDPIFAGAYATAAFTNLWLRQQQASAPHDQQLAAVYTSVLQGVDWRAHSGSPLLDAMRAASDDGWLSINMNVFGYGRDPSIARYTLGYAVGSIGPHRAASPKHFVVGRQLIPDIDQDTLGPVGGVAYVSCVVDKDAKRLSADFGNALPLRFADGGFVDLGPLQLALAKTDPDAALDKLALDAVVLLGEVDYPREALATGTSVAARSVPAWYAQTAGIVDLDYGKAGDWVAQHIGERALLVCTPTTAADGSSMVQVRVQESIHGLYVRPDQYVYRLDPGESAEVDIRCARFGLPYATKVAFGTNLGMMGGDGVGGPGPAINTGTLTYLESMKTGEDGRATLKITVPAAGPGNPRGYIDGQLYGVGCTLPEQPAGSVQNMWNFVSLLVFSRLDVPAQPNWYDDIQPIFQQYANLYPIMSRHLIDLGDYDAVLPHLRILEMAFSLPAEDPNQMPVTRDLSDARRQMILRWLRQPGPDGKPLKGTPKPLRASAVPPEAPPEPPSDLQLDPLQTAGKTAIVLAYRARQRKLEQQP